MFMGVSMWLCLIGVLAVAQCIQIQIEVCPTPGRPTRVCGFGPSKNGCTANSQCSPGFLCCLDGCGRQCKPALALKVKSRAGYCPAPPTSSLVSCPTTIRNECHMDADCEDSKKCCFHPCGSRCMNSFPQSRLLKEGICPLPQQPIACPGELVDTCDIDDDCAGQLKCCFHPCGRSCLNVKRQTVILKPGACPMPFNGFCNLARRDHCSSDADCAGTQKCCSLPCGRSCVQSTALMHSKARGQGNPLCPPNDGLAGTCVFDPSINCLSDDQCSSKGQICCSSGCNSICKNPVPINTLPFEKEGTCPASRPLAVTSCLLPISDSCQVDADCRGDEKCCDDPCGKQCLDPAVPTNPFPLPVIKQGSCPVPASGFLVRCAFNDTCLSDSECTGTQKCCKSPCGKYCAAPVKSKAGTCPADSKCEGLRDDCYKDADCSGSQKCCKTSCGNRCTGVTDPVVIPFPGGQNPRCPASDVLVGICLFDPNVNCLSDKECASKGQICCNNGCSSICKNPLPETTLPIVKEGTCPKPLNPALVLCALPITDQCSDDSMCKGDLKCCENPCGKYCDLVRSKPGNCPAITLTRSPCGIQCDNDNDCPLSQKCCTSSCGKSCVDASSPAPIPVTKPQKPGRCPRRRLTFRFRCWIRRNFCKDDYSCRGNAKCCQGRCGRRCSRPIRENRRGVCPVSPKNVNCFRYQNDCETDSECSGSMKCCSTACGVGCVQPRFYKG